MSVLERIAKNKAIKDSVLSEETSEIKGFISTGCTVLNLLFPGRLNGGIPLKKVSQIAAPSSLGKSFIGLKVAKNAQKQFGMDVVILDTEFAFDFNFSGSVGVDPAKSLVIQDNQIESCQTKLISMLADLTQDEKDNLLVVIDSWGGLVTSKSMGDALDGKDVVDMTAARKKNNFARLLTGMGVTVFVINQTYETMDQYNPLKPGGGNGIYFASSSIVMGTSKARDKDAQEIVGAVVTAKVLKGRFSREHSKLKFTIKHDGGIHPTSGIEDDLVEFGYLTKPTVGWYSRNFEKLGLEGEDRKWRMKEIHDNWGVFYKDVLKHPDVLKDFEAKYTHAHNNIIDDTEEFFI